MVPQKITASADKGDAFRLAAVPLSAPSQLDKEDAALAGVDEPVGENRPVCLVS